MIPTEERESFIRDHRAGMSHKDLSAKYHIGMERVRTRVIQFGLSHTRPYSNALITPGIDRMILLGRTNAEIKAAFPGTGKSLLGHRRRCLGKLTRPAYNRIQDQIQEPKSEPKVVAVLPIRCPHCGSRTNGSHCIMCGTSGEQKRWS